jgi:hypothetical protein
MKVSGYALREAIKQQELRKETAAGAFNGSLKAFPNEEKEAPANVMAVFNDAENALVKLQVAQMRYNLMVTVDVGGASMTLAEAIKRLGPVGRIEKMWKSAIADPQRAYGYEEPTLDASKVYQQRTIPSKDAMKFTSDAGKQASALRAAIAVANGKEVEIEDLDPSLFK